MIHVNLLPKPRRSALARRSSSRLWIMGGAGYAAIVIISGLVFSLSGPRSAVASDLFERQERELTDRDARVAELTLQTESLNRRLERLRRIQNHPDMSSLVRLIASRLQDRIVLDSMTFDRSVQQPAQASRKKIGADAASAPDVAPQAPRVSYQIDIAGIARQQADVTSFVLRLEELGLFDKVTVVDSGKREVQGAELAQFRLRCQVEETASRDLPQPGKGAAK